MANQPTSSGFAPRRLLVRGVNWLGDAVITTPALQRLREALPNSHLTLLTPEKLAELWKAHPAINDVLTFTPRESIGAVARRLRAQQFDAALVLPNSPRSALESWLAGIPIRIGYRQPWRNLFLNWTIPLRPDHLAMHKLSTAEVKARIAKDDAPPKPIPASAHHIHHYLHLVGALGANPEPLRPLLTIEKSEIDQTLTRFGLQKEYSSGRNIIGLNPGAEYGPAKRWPSENFVRTAIEAGRKINCVWLIFGGSADAALAATIADAVSAKSQSGSCLNLAGKTSLRELMALMKICRLVLTNDTGPMHVAAALGTPVVVPYGSTSPELTGPGLPGDSSHCLIKSTVPCSPCFRRTCPIDFRCMRQIGIEQVVAAVVGSVGVRPSSGAATRI